MGSTVAQTKTFRDFEIIWQDGCSNNPIDMDDVSLSIYHYEQADAGSVTVSNPEPYIITEGVNDLLNIGTTSPVSGFVQDEEIILDLSIVGSDLCSLDCPPNNYQVSVTSGGGTCGGSSVPVTTSSKVAIINGYNVYALSACEVASLINIEATGFTASHEDGFVVLTSNLTGEDYCLQIGVGTINPVLGITANDEYCGFDLRRIYDLGDAPMTWVSTGTYVIAGENLIDPPYLEGERYFAIYKGFEPVTGRPFFQQEDFTILKDKKCCNLTFSFLG